MMMPNFDEHWVSSWGGRMFVFSVYGLSVVLLLDAVVADGLLFECRGGVGYIRRRGICRERLLHRRFLHMRHVATLNIGRRRW